MGDYKKHIEPVKGHTLGYVNEWDIDKTSMPANALIDCNNMDFYADHDRRRPPYNVLLDLSSLLPTNYVILKYHFKTFYDKNGNEKECIIVAARNTVTGAFKIYIKGYYCPKDTSYDNFNGSAADQFNDNFVELTERITPATIDVGSYSGYTHRFADAVNTTTNYYKGFFGVISNGTTKKIQGIISSSIHSVGGTDYTYFNISAEALISGYSLVELVRFPVTEYNAANWNTITEVNFMDNDANSVKVLLGDKSDMLWVGFLQDKSFFSTIGATDVTYSGAHTGWVRRTQGSYSLDTATQYKLLVRISGTTVSFYWTNLTESGVGSPAFSVIVSSTGDTVDYTFFVELGFYINIYAVFNTFVDRETAIFTIPAASRDKWDGIWMSWDEPKVANKRRFIRRTTTITMTNYLNQELGIELVPTTTEYTALTKNDRAYAMAVEFDGYQSFYLRHFLCNNKYSITNMGVNFYKHYDRRISAFLTFFKEFETDITDSVIKEGIIPDTYLLDSSAQGYNKINNICITDAANIYTGICFADGLDGNASSFKKAATGLSLNSYLNEYYYSDHIRRARSGINISGSIILYGIKKPIGDISNKSSDITNNESIIVFSQLQNAGVDCNSIFSVERIRQVAREKILAVTPLAGADFLILTKKKIYWKSIQAQASALLKDEGEYETFGLVSEKGIAAARMMDTAPIGTVAKDFGAKNFKGIYWTGYKAYYGFMGNTPVPINENRWDKEYRALTDTEKGLIVTGYNAEKEEIWNYIPAKSIDNKPKIYIWNIAGKHWKKYTLAADDVPQNFRIATDSRMTWNNGTKIFKMETDKYLSDGTSTLSADATCRMDKGTAAIDFFIEKMLNHGSSDVWKIPDIYNLLYDIVTNTTSTGSGAGTVYTLQTGKIKVTLKEMKGLDFNYDMEATPNAYKIHTLITNAIQTQLPIKHKIRRRIHTKWYKMRIESERESVDKIVSFRLNGVINQALLTGGKIIETK